MTDWKDTVMSDYKILESGLKNPTYESMHNKHCPLSWVKVAQAQAEISFKAGQEEEYKKWVEAFMKAGIMIASADMVCVAVEETKREGIRKVVEWIRKNMKWEEEHYSGQSIGFPDSTGGIIPLTTTYYLISKVRLQAFLKEKGIVEV